MDGTPRDVTPQQVQQQLRALRMMEDVSLVLAAREDPNIFIECIGRIEGQAWVGKQAGAHAMMQDHLTRASAQAGASTAVILCPVGHGKCLVDGAEISTPGGTERIERLQVGDEVLAPDPTTGAIGRAPICETYDCGDQPIRRVTTASGKTLVCADTHPIWSSGSDQQAPTWTLAADLLVGARVLSIGSSSLRSDRVAEVEPLGTARCSDIEVASPSHAYIADGVVAHNSNQVTRWRVVWELGKNPNLRVLLMSATTALPEKMLAGIKGDITDNPFVAAVFPHLRPGHKKGQCDWSGSRIHVDRPDNLPDASITTAGLSSKILGSRFDLIVIDDLLNTDNTLTPYMRKQVWQKVQSEVMSRRPPHLPSRAWFVGHPWTEDDGMAQAQHQAGARTLHLGARVQRHAKTGKVITSADPDWSEVLAWLPLLPTLWTKEALAARYAELRWAARHMLDTLFMRRGGGGFAPEGIARALVNGKGISYKLDWNPLATGCQTYTGVDVSSGEGEDFTVIVTAVRLASGRRQILEIQSGKWTGPEICERLRSVYMRFRSIISVESNGVQKWLRQWLGTGEAIITPVFDSHTGANKADLNLGIKHLEMELAGDGMWIFPRPRNMFDPPDEDMLALCNGAQSYSRDEKHTSDWLMAWWICWRKILADEGVAIK